MQSSEGGIGNLLPDLVLLVRRDGLLLEMAGGEAVLALRPPRNAIGERLESGWPDAVAALVRQLVRRCLSLRTSVDAEFESGGVRYQLRATARGPERALCVIRLAPTATPLQMPPETAARSDRQLDRRGFLRRLRDTLSRAVLRESPLALAVIHLDGLSDIAKVLDAAIAQQLQAEVLSRLDTADVAGTAESGGCLGQLGEAVLALVVESTDRQLIEARLHSLCSSLAQPVSLGDASFHLVPCAGVAVLGQDASSARTLLAHAHSAASEARRSGGRQVHFFTDTLKLRSLARLDIARELAEAIERREIGLRYRSRHELASGRMVARVAYLRWSHPLRGEIRPAEFLRLAATTGLARALSLSVLGEVRRELTALASSGDADVCLSFGALRHHILHEDFVSDIAGLLRDSALPAARLELRIAERTFVLVDREAVVELRGLGVCLAVDEVGRQLCSFDRLAEARPTALQIDRAIATRMRTDSQALAVVRMTHAVAQALGAQSIATGVDDDAQLTALRDSGYGYGQGDYYSVETRSVAGVADDGRHSLSHNDLARRLRR